MQGIGKANNVVCLICLVWLDNTPENMHASIDKMW